MLYQPWTSKGHLFSAYKKLFLEKNPCAKTQASSAPLQPDAAGLDVELAGKTAPKNRYT